MNTKQIREFAKQHNDFDRKMRDLARENEETVELGDKVFKLISAERVNSEMEILIQDQDKNFYEFFGSYDSWNGTEYDGISYSIIAVNPVQKMVTVYEQI